MLEYSPQAVETRVKNELNQSLEALLREGARKMLQAALEMEVAAYVAACASQRDERGHRQVVKNGHHPQRALVTGVGAIPLKQPRVNDRRSGERFTSAILPRYMRRAPSIGSSGSMTTSIPKPAPA
jgi:transposase-like protein